MSKKYGIYCENCNVLLSNEDNIFGTNFGQLYHSTCMDINYGKSAGCQPLTLFKMNLKFADTPTIITEAEREIMELKNSSNAARQSVKQLEAKIKTLEDALLVQDHLKDDVNKLMDCVVKLANTLSIKVVDKTTDIVNNTSQGKSNKQAYDENFLIGDDSPLTAEAEEENIEHISSNNGVLQSVQELADRIKTLKDALLQTKSDGNKLADCEEIVEMNKAVNKASDDGNNITQDPKASKETHNENNLSGEQHNDIENVASATSEEQHTCTVSVEKKEVVDLRRNCVLIQNPERNCKSLDEAFSYVRELANEMNALIADNSVIHVDMDFPQLYVYFRDTDSKIEFLKNRFIFEYNPDTKRYLRILDYTDCGILDIGKIHSFDLSLEKAFVYVLELAQKMGIKNNRNFIDHIDVYLTDFCKSVYSVRFNSQDMKNTFLQKKYNLKLIPETKSLEILDKGGHTSSKYNVNNFSIALASANVIGLAELMGLSLSTYNVKRTYVLSTKAYDHIEDVHVSLAVEFSSNDIKNKFLKKNSELNEIANTWSSDIDISDIKAEANVVSIKYKPWSYMFTAMSFIGLTKQLGFSLTPDQTDRFIKLSEFISKASS